MSTFGATFQYRSILDENGKINLRDASQPDFTITERSDGPNDEIDSLGDITPDTFNGIGGSFQYAGAEYKFDRIRGNNRDACRWRSGSSLQQ